MMCHCTHPKITWCNIEMWHASKTRMISRSLPLSFTSLYWLNSALHFVPGLHFFLQNHLLAILVFLGWMLRNCPYWKSGSCTTTPLATWEVMSPHKLKSKHAFLNACFDYNLIFSRITWSNSLKIDSLEWYWFPPSFLLTISMLNPSLLTELSFLDWYVFLTSSPPTTYKNNTFVCIMGWEILIFEKCYDVKFWRGSYKDRQISIVFPCWSHSNYLPCTKPTTYFLDFLLIFTVLLTGSVGNHTLEGGWSGGDSGCIINIIKTSYHSYVVTRLGVYFNSLKL